MPLAERGSQYFSDQFPFLSSERASSMKRRPMCGRVCERGEQLEHTFLSVQSHLFPIRILFTPSDACCSTFECQVLMSVCPPLDISLLLS